jgi:glycosyltransferase involved in cell wall biosynthesis
MERGLSRRSGAVSPLPPFGRILSFFRLQAMRVGVYTDYTYHRVGGRVFAERAFALFLARLAPQFERFFLIGREHPEPGRVRYPVGSHVDFVPLPFYSSLADPLAVLRTSLQAAARFWRALGDIDCVWLLGPHPLATVFVFLCTIRRKRVILGVRQDTRAYLRSRHPDRRSLRLAGAMLDAIWRMLARWFPVVAVGSGIAAHYARAKALIEITVSLVDERDVVPPAVALARPYEGELRAISVGRLEAVNNPQMLADVMALLRESSDRWRLTVCGEGDMQGALEERLRELDVHDRVELVGYVPFGSRLFALYRESHALLHVSWTEGLPQVLAEAFGAGLPAVATDVGGVASAVRDAVALVPPGDPRAAASALEAVAADPRLRERLVRAGHAWVRDHTITAELNRVQAFLRSA